MIADFIDSSPLCTNSCSPYGPFMKSKCGAACTDETRSNGNMLETGEQEPSKVEASQEGTKPNGSVVVSLLRFKFGDELRTMKL